MPTIPNTNVAPTAAQIGWGAQFSTGVTVGNTTTYTPVAEVIEIKPSGVTVGEEDRTNLGSPGAQREYIPGLVDNGTVEWSGSYIADVTQVNMETLARARTIFPWEYQFLVGGKTETRSGRGFFTKLTPGDITIDKAPTFNATLRITGVVTVADV
jgi:hypothetical protein